jgi:hypothetical protein
MSERTSAQKHESNRVIRKLTATAMGLIALTSCLPKFSAWSGEGDGPRVAIVGDSVMNAAENGPGANSVNTLLTAPLEAEGYRTTKATMIGSTTRDLKGLSNTSTEEGRTSGGVFAPGADIGVSNHGANDARVSAETGQSAIPLQESIDNLEDFIRELDVECFVIVGLPEPNLDEIPTEWGHENFAPQWNDYWKQRANNYESGAIIVYADWDATIDSMPAENMQLDGIHPEEAGREKLRTLVIDSVDICAGAIAG